MGNIKDSVEAVKAERAANAKAADDQGNGKTAEELKRDLIEKDLIENRAAIEALKEKEAKEPGKKPAKESGLKIHTVEPVIEGFKEHTTKPMIEPLKEYTTEPVRNPIGICPFCLEEKTVKGMGRHVAAKHEIPDFTIQDLDDVENDRKSLPDLVREKFDGPATIADLSPEVEAEHFSDWKDIEEPEKDLEELEIDDEKRAKIQVEIDDQEKAKAVEKNPGNPGLKDSPGEKKGFWQRGIWPWV